MQKNTPAPNLAPTCFGLFLFAFFCAFAQVSLRLDALGFGRGLEVPNVARHLAATGEFGDPFSIPTGSTAHVAPVYTALMALAFKILGFTYSAALVLTLLNAVLVGIGAALLPVLSLKVFGHTAPGIVAGILVVVSGKLMPEQEVALSGALLVSTTLVLMSCGRFASGLSVAASILTNPVSVLPLVVIMIHRGGRWFAAAGGLALLFCLPWIARNYLVLGAPYFVRDNFGLELYLSNNDQAQPEMMNNIALRLHPTGNTAEAAQVAVQGEGPYNRAKLRSALNWIWHNPQRFISLTATRISRYWFPLHGWETYGCRLINALAIVGGWLARRNSMALLLALAAICYSLPYAVIQADPKYGYPMLWASALLAGYAVHTLLSRSGLLRPEVSIGAVAREPR